MRCVGVVGATAILKGTQAKEHISSSPPAASPHLHCCYCTGVAQQLQPSRQLPAEPHTGVSVRRCVPRVRPPALVEGGHEGRASGRDDRGEGVLVGWGKRKGC